MSVCWQSHWCHSHGVHLVGFRKDGQWVWGMGTVGAHLGSIWHFPSWLLAVAMCDKWEEVVVVEPLYDSWPPLPSVKLLSVMLWGKRDTYWWLVDVVGRKNNEFPCWEFNLITLCRSFNRLDEISIVDQPVLVLSVFHPISLNIHGHNSHSNVARWACLLAVSSFPTSRGT